MTVNLFDRSLASAIPNTHGPAKHYSEPVPEAIAAVDAEAYFGDESTAPAEVPQSIREHGRGVKVNGVWYAA